MEKDLKTTIKGIAVLGTVYGIITIAMVVASQHPQVFTY